MKTRTSSPADLSTQNHNRHGANTKSFLSTQAWILEIPIKFWYVHRENIMIEARACHTHVWSPSCVFFPWAHYYCTSLSLREAMQLCESCAAGGRPSTWVPLEELVEQLCCNRASLTFPRFLNKTLWTSRKHTTNNASEHDAMDTPLGMKARLHQYKSACNVSSHSERRIASTSSVVLINMKARNCTRSCLFSILLLYVLSIFLSCLSLYWFVCTSTMQPLPANLCLLDPSTTLMIDELLSSFVESFF